MSRQIYQKSGLIVALVLAAVSLPIGIIGLTQEPTVIKNYYNDYYNTYNNQTYYGSNETDYNKPLETTEYYNLDYRECIIRNFTLSSNYAYWFHYNFTTQFQLYFYVVRSVFLERIIELNGTIECMQFLDNIRVQRVDFSSTSEKSSFYIPPFLDEWLFVFMDMQDSFLVNITLTDEVLPI